MSTEGYLLFSKCHIRYIYGVRTALRERLVTVHADSWWEEGVLSRVSDDQRLYLERRAHHKRCLRWKTFWIRPISAQ